MTDTLFTDDMSEEEAALLEQQKAQDAEDQAAAEAEEKEAEGAETQPEGDDPAGEQKAADEEKKEPQRVPLGELLDERKARQRAQEELNEFRERYAKLDGRLEELSERFKAPAEAAPDPDEDPVGHISHQHKQIRERQDKLDERLSTQDQKSEELRRWQEFDSRVAAEEAAFRQANPDRPYDEALKFLRESRDGEYQAMGITDPIRRQQMIAQDAVFIGQQAMAQGKSPAQAAWDLATARGFSASVEGKPAPSEADEKITQLAKGQQASKSLSSAGGRAEVPKSLEALANMDDDEFGQLTEKEFRRIMGG